MVEAPHPQSVNGGSIDKLNLHIMPPVVIVVATNPRSGSTFFCDLLQSIVGGQQAGEWLNPDVAFPFEALCPDDVRRRAASLRRLAQEGAPVILKIIYRDFEDALAQGIDALSLLPEARVIFLTRENKTQQAISLIKAIQADVWHQKRAENTPASRYDSAEMVYDPMLIDWYIDSLSRADAQWREALQARGLTVYALSYEMLLAQPAMSLDQVSRYLGRDEANRAQVAPAFQPVGDGLNHQWEHLYNEYKQGRASPLTHVRDLWLEAVPHCDEPGFLTWDVRIQNFGSEPLVSNCAHAGKDLCLEVAVLQAAWSIPGRRRIVVSKPLPSIIEPRQVVTQSLRVSKEDFDPSSAWYACLIRRHTSVIRIIGPNTPILHEAAQPDFA